MKLNIQDIKEEGLSLDLATNAEETSLLNKDVGVRLSVPVKLHLDLSLVGKDIYLKGTLEALVKLPCSRCLADFDLAIDSTFIRYFKEASLIDDADAKEGEERELTEEEIDINHYEGDELDITPVMVEELSLGLPTKPLCKIDCLGLCQKCGVDMNTTACGCAIEEKIDLRFSKLKELKINKDR